MAADGWTHDDPRPGRGGPSEHCPGAEQRASRDGVRLSIAYVGTPSGTCVQRARALQELGHLVTFIPAESPGSRGWRYQLYRLLRRLRPAPDLLGSNRRLLSLARAGGIDLVWVDKGLSIRPETLRRVRERLPKVRIVSYSPDDMLNPLHQSPAYLSAVPEYDLHVTTKSYNVEELKGLGARDVLFVDNAYDPRTHRPMELSAEDRRRFGTGVGFIGIYEEERAEMMLRLASAGIRVVVHGPDWAHLGGSNPNLVLGESWLEDENYARAVNATRVNLGFLRKGNRDLQTTRSVEIPACGGFLLAERTAEHQRLFREGVEAEFFEGFEELLRKCRYYLEHEDDRRRIAAAGLRRCVDGGYSNRSRLAGVIDHLLRQRGEAEAAPRQGAS